MRRYINIIEAAARDSIVTLYHGTCPANAEALCRSGWQPGSGQQGANMGQTRYLYLSTGLEDAEWFASEKGCSTVLAVTTPISSLIVDPEDGISVSVEDELNLSHGLPGKLALRLPLGPEHFQIVRK